MHSVVIASDKTFVYFWNVSHSFPSQCFNDSSTYTQGIDSTHQHERAMAQRIHKDFAKLFKAPPPDCILETGDDEGESTEEGTGADALSLSSVTFVLLGPEATAYHGGAWRVRLRVPATYPRAAPAAHFLTRIFHPNVRPDTGEVCVDTLKRDWRADLDLTQVILVSTEY